MFWNLFNLLTSESSDSAGKGKGGPDYVTWIIMGVAIIMIIVLMVLSRRSQKKKQDETMAMLDAIAPGSKVKTIGGICGIVVEVCPEDNTFILETGSEASGKSYIKFDKQAVYQTDAVPKKAEDPVEAPAVEAPVEAPATETPATEAPAAEATEEKAE